MGRLKRVQPSTLRFFFWLFVAVLALLLSAFAYPWLLHARARARLEKVAGPLAFERIDKPKLPPGNPGVQLLRIGEALDLSEQERDFLKQTLRGGRPAILTGRRRIEAVIGKNLETLRRAEALGDGPSSLNLDYADPEWRAPNLLPQINLSRLLYLQGTLALEDGDIPAALQAVQDLGRVALLLEREPPVLLQMIGFVAERHQLQLALQLVESGQADPVPFLLDNDLPSLYRKAILFEAVNVERAIDKTLREWSLFGRWVRGFVSAGSLDGYRLYLEAPGRDYVWIDEHLGTGQELPPKFHIPRRLGALMAPSYPQFVAAHRAVSSSRSLIRACQRARAEGQSGIVLRVLDGPDYHRLFDNVHVMPAPQECRLPPRARPSSPTHPES